MHMRMRPSTCVLPAPSTGYRCAAAAQLCDASHAVADGPFVEHPMYCDEQVGQPRVAFPFLCRGSLSAALSQAEQRGLRPPPTPMSRTAHVHRRLEDASAPCRSE